MNKQQILALMTDDVSIRQAAIRDFIMNTSVPFEDRLEVYLATPEHLYSTYGGILYFNEFNGKYGEISWYDDFYTEKGSEVDLAEIIREAKNGEHDDTFFSSQEKIDDFIREAVDSGYHSFYFSW